MPYSINDKEFASVSALEPAERLAHFVKRVTDWEEVWSIKSHDGWVLLETSDGHEIAPFWLHPRSARACISDRWAGSEPVVIELQAFVERWIPGLQCDGRKVSVFPTLSSPGAVVAATTLAEAITEELGANYGGDL